MGLKSFLYRCPFCGHDPLEGKGRTAHCASCSRSYGPGTESAHFRVSEPGGKDFEVLGSELARRIVAFDGPMTRAREADGRVRFSSVATARFSFHEEPYRHQGRLLGFIEQYGRPVRGTLELEAHRICFHPIREARWTLDLLDVMAFQASSSSVQISYGTEKIASFRLREESAYRWEDLFKRQLREVWSNAGRGAIVEFQPRIRCG